MSVMGRSILGFKLPLGLVSGMAMLCTASGSAVAQGSEIDSYDRAITVQSKEAALAFLRDFRSSHLVGDLIESLRPDIAREVCAELPSGVSRARRACERLPAAPVAATTPAAGEPAGSTAQSNAVAAPTQPIQTQPTDGMPSPPVTGAVPVPSQGTALAAGGQSELTAPATATPGGGGVTDPATAAAGSALSSSGLPEQAAMSPPMPIKSRPTVYVRPDSDATVLAQAWEGSVVIGKASGNTPLTVVARDRSWLKVLVPGTGGQEGWVHTSALQMDSRGVKVGPASAAIPITATSSAATDDVAVAPAAGGGSEIGPPAAPAAHPTTSMATGTTLPPLGASQTAAIAPPTPIKSRPTVYVRPDSTADILAQATEGSVVVGTVSGNTPLTVVGRDRSWLKILVPGTAGQEGWVHTSVLQSDAGGIMVGPASATTPTPATSSATTLASPPQVATSTSSTATVAPAAAGATNVPAGGPVVRIWLASVKSRELAERDWRDLQAAYGNLLVNLEPTVRQVDLGPKKGGIWYRIYAGPLASRDKARTLCAEIKSRPPKSNCLVVIE